MSIAAISAVSAVAAVGMSVYGAISAPGSPGVYTPPPPPNSVTYNEDGGIQSSQTYDAKTNTWITKGPELTAEQKAEKAKLKDLRNQTLDNLTKTPEGRTQAYADYAKAYSDSAHQISDPEFAKISRAEDEQANARGLFGSRAYVDAKDALNRDKLTQDTQIADQATMQKETLANNDRTYWANLLNQIDSGTRSDVINQNNVNKTNADIANQNYAGTLSAANIMNSGILAKYQAQLNQSASYTNAGSNLAGGLMYLYGKNSGGSSLNTGSALTGGGGGVQKYGQSFSLMNG